VKDRICQVTGCGSKSNLCLLNVCDLKETYKIKDTAIIEMVYCKSHFEILKTISNECDKSLRIYGLQIGLTARCKDLLKYINDMEGN
jgi:hypothetical protein